MIHLPRHRDRSRGYFAQRCRFNREIKIIRQRFTCLPGCHVGAETCQFRQLKEKLTQALKSSLGFYCRHGVAPWRMKQSWRTFMTMISHKVFHESCSVTCSMLEDKWLKIMLKACKGNCKQFARYEHIANKLVNTSTTQARVEFKL